MDDCVFGHPIAEEHDQFELRSDERFLLICGSVVRKRGQVFKAYRNYGRVEQAKKKVVKDFVLDHL